MVQKLKMLTAKPVGLSSIPRTYLVEKKLSSDPHTHAACSHVQTDRCDFFYKKKKKTLLPHQVGLMLDRQWGTPQVPGQARPGRHTASLPLTQPGPSFGCSAS